MRLFCLIVLGFIGFSGCKPDEEEPPCQDPANPECGNYDPCFGKIETTAYFTIAQQYFPIGENADVFIEDDVVTGGLLKFKAIFQEGATYTWILGADTIVGGHETTIQLGNLPQGSYANSLIVTKQSDTLCFPTDNGVATFSRSFTRIDRCDRAFLGRYRGVFASFPGDSVEIELVASSSVTSVEPCEEPSNQGAVFSINFRLENDTTRLYLNGAVNSRFSFESLGTIGTAEGEFIYDYVQNVGTANYEIDDIEYLFTGRKLN